MSFLVRTIGRVVISTVVSTVVTLAVKEVAERRTKRKRAVPRLSDERTRKPAQTAKASETKSAE